MSLRSALITGKAFLVVEPFELQIEPKEFTPLENTMESLLLKEDIANAPFLYDLPCVEEKVSLHKSSGAGHIKLIHRK